MAAAGRGYMQIVETQSTTRHRLGSGSPHIHVFMAMQEGMEVVGVPAEVAGGG